MTYTVTFKSKNEDYKVELNPTSSQVIYSVGNDVVRVKEVGTEFNHTDLLKQAKQLASKMGVHKVQKSW